MTPIQEFFQDSSVLITGVTGFLGKALLEKIIRSCPGVNNVYVIIRHKKNKEFSTRLEELLQEPLFERALKEVPNFKCKVFAVAGDCSLPNLGLSEEDQQLLQEKVSIVFHSAASVNFEENIKVAVDVNVRGPLQMIELCRGMANLKVLEIEEKFYPPPKCSNRIFKLVDTLTDDDLNILKPKLLENWPNIYTMTKAVAEHFVKDNVDLPVCVFRPAIVSGALDEPIPGWVDNFNGASGLCYGTWSGIVRVFYCDKNLPLNMVPIDLTVNGIITAAKHTYESFQSCKIDHYGQYKIPVYNSESASSNPITLSDAGKLNTLKPHDSFFTKFVWGFLPIMCQYKLSFEIVFYILHTLPAIILSSIFCSSDKSDRILQLNTKIKSSLTRVAFVVSTNYTFQNENLKSLILTNTPEDQVLFNMDVRSVKWVEYMNNFMVGVVKYAVKEEPPKALRFFVAVYILILVAVFGVFHFLCFLI